MQAPVAAQEFQEIVSKYPVARESLIPALQEIQESEGYLPEAGIFAVAEHLGLPVSKVFGVVTFYNQFKLKAPGKYQIQLCRGTACHVKGSLSILDTLEAELGIKPGDTTADGRFSIEVVACIGACSIAPVIAINGEFHGRLDKKKLLSILDFYRTKESVDV